MLDETQAAIQGILSRKNKPDPAAATLRARNAIENSFAEAMVDGFDDFLAAAAGLPDPKDAHVVAGALKTKADVIVTNNLKHFPSDKLKALGLEVCNADAFIANTFMLDEDLAVSALGRMRERFQKPDMTPDELLRSMTALEMTETVDVLRHHIGSL